MRTGIATAFIVLAIASSAQAAGPHIERRFVEPARGLSIRLPDGWTAHAGYGETIAVFEGPRGQVFRMIGSADGGDISNAKIKSLISNLHPDARFERRGKKRRDVFTLGADAEKKGVAIRGGGKGCEYVAICEGSASEFAETFLGCRELVRSATCAAITDEGCHSHASALDEIPTPDLMDGLNILDGGGALSAAKASRISLMKGMFVLLDGRSSCPGVREEVKRMSENLRRRGCVHQAATLDVLGRLLSDPDDASMLRRFAKGTGGNLKRLLEAIALEASGSVVSAAQVYAKLANGSDGFFAALRLARLRMDGDDVDGAIEVLARIKGKRGSNLLAALDLGLARAYGDRAAAAEIAGGFDGEMCGESGALAAYEMGRITAPEDSKAARRYFEAALDADPGLAPAYPALGRAMVASGVSALRASELLLKRLTRAPRSREIGEMRGRLEKYLAKLSRGPVDLISHP